MDTVDGVPTMMRSLDASWIGVILPGLIAVILSEDVAEVLLASSSVSFP